MKSLFTAKRLFVLSLLTVFFLYGFLVGKFRVFPFSIMSKAYNGWLYIKSDLGLFGTPLRGIFQAPAKSDSVKTIFETNNASNELVLIALVEDKDVHTIKLLEKNGEIINKWEIDYDKLLESSDNFNNKNFIIDDFTANIPLLIHGVKLLPNGDILFNIESKALCKLNWNGEILWVKNIRSHHSIEIDFDGNILVCAEGPVRKDIIGQEVFIDQSIVKLNANGDFIASWSLIDLFRENNLTVLMNTDKMDLGTRKYHLNDAEPYLFEDESGVFGRGDILISCRNISTVLVFNQFSLKVKKIFNNYIINQHDPDFVDSETISVYENIFSDLQEKKRYTRIISFNTNTNEFSALQPKKHSWGFKSVYMGKHQRLENGNMLITFPENAQVVEVDSLGEIQWMYTNILSEEYHGYVFEAHSIPRVYLNIDK